MVLDDIQTLIFDCSTVYQSGLEQAVVQVRNHAIHEYRDESEGQPQRRVSTHDALQQS